MCVHTFWLVLFIVTLIAAVAFLGLLFASTVSEKFLPKRRLFAILMVITALLCIVSNRQYQLSIPQSSQIVTTTKKKNAVDRYLSPLTKKPTSFDKTR